jgi:hypothetical protein
MQTIYINWYGPFSEEEILENSHCTDNAKLMSNGLYALVGKLKKKRDCKLQYIGITTRKFRSRFRDRGHIIHDITRELAIWIGKTAYTRKTQRSLLEAAEYMLIHFSDSEELQNKRKTQNPPNGSYTVLSQFLTKTGDKHYMRLHQTVRAIPGVLIWENNRLRYCTRLIPVDFR